MILTQCIDTLRTLWPCHDGPAHIVLADFNLRDQNIEWCLSQIEEGNTYSDLDISNPVFTATKAILEYMLKIPEEVRLKWCDHSYEFLYGVKND